MFLATATLRPRTMDPWMPPSAPRLPGRTLCWSAISIPSQWLMIRLSSSVDMGQAHRVAGWVRSLGSVGLPALWSGLRAAKAVSGEEILMKAEAAAISAQSDRVLPRLPHSAMCLICIFIPESDYAVHIVTDLPDATLRLGQARWKGSRHPPKTGSNAAGWNGISTES